MRRNKMSFVMISALLVALIPMIGAALAGTQRWVPLTAAEMAGLRGSNASRGTFTLNCSQFQAIDQVPGNWSCNGDNDGADCDMCSETGNVTYADQGGALPRNMTDGAGQNCGTTSNAAKCKNSVCQGNTFSTSGCNQPKAAKAQ